MQIAQIFFDVHMGLAFKGLGEILKKNKVDSRNAYVVFMNKKKNKFKLLMNDTVTIEEQAKQTVATARAEAEAMRIKSAALASNRGLVEFELAQKWDGKLPVYMLGNSTPMIDMRSLTK